MEGFYAALPAVLVILACPLMMIVPGVGVWLWARARGERRQLSVGCMPGHTEQPTSSVPQPLEGEVAELRRQVRTLQAQLQADGRVDVASTGDFAAIGRE